jgi:NADH-quinone oxidoreductase E subunit
MSGFPEIRIRSLVMEKVCLCEAEAIEGEFSEAQWSKIDSILKRFHDKPGALIPALEEIQEVTGYLPESIQRYVAKSLNIPLGQVYGVVTFYSFFTMKPRGKHQIRVCLGTACHVRGSKRILEKVERELNIEPGECTEDRNFGLDVVRCLGACGLAPVMMVDEETMRQVKADKVSQILSQYTPSVPDAER